MGTLMTGKQVDSDVAHDERDAYAGNHHLHPTPKKVERQKNK